ncbi:hypothetical protein AAKU67_003781 [Oxalobacteraceae bacterium GrIS 2.11]
MLNPIDNRQQTQNVQNGSPLPVPTIPSAQKIQPVVEPGSAASTADHFQEKDTASTSARQPVINAPPGDLASAPSFHTILITLQQLFADSNIASTQQKVTLNNALINTRSKNLDDAVNAIGLSKDYLNKAMTDLSAKNQQLAEAQTLLGDKASQFDAAQNQLNIDQARADAILADLNNNPGDLVREKKYQEAVAVVATSSQKLTAAQNSLTAAQDAYILAGNAAVDAATNAVAAQQQLVQCTNDYLKLTPGAAASQLITTDELKSSMQIMMECMMQLSEILGKYNESKLRSQNELFQQVQNALIAECKALAQKFSDAMKLAKSIQDGMKIAVKIFGAIVLALSGIAAVATGGLGSVLVVAASAGVMAADAGLDAAGKETLTSHMMNPVMNGLTKLIVGLIKELKPDIDDEAQMIASIVAMVVVAIGAMAASRAAGGLSSKLPSTGLQSAGTDIAKLGRQVQTGSEVLSFTNTTAQAGAGIAVGKIQADGKNNEGSLVERTADQSNLEKLVKEVVDNYCNTNISYELMQFLFSYIQEHGNTAKQMSWKIPA